MSYRDKHPNPPVWTYEQSITYRTPDPYDRAGSENSAAGRHHLSQKIFLVPNGNTNNL